MDLDGIEPSSGLYKSPVLAVERQIHNICLRHKSPVLAVERSVLGLLIISNPNLQMKLNRMPDTSSKEISEHITHLREEKGKEQEVLEIIKKALTHGHGLLVNLLWGETLNIS